jgi:membrane-bound lytic murein transglycosylase D
MINLLCRSLVIFSAAFILSCGLPKNETAHDPVMTLPDELPVLSISIENELGAEEASSNTDRDEYLKEEIEVEKCVQGCDKDLEPEKTEEPPPELNGDDNFVKAEEDPLESLDKDQNLLDNALELCNTSQELWSEGNLEKAIETLDQAYMLAMEVDTERNPELIQQKEDIRFLISKRILEIYASRYTAVNGNHNEIPLTMNKHVEKEIKRFQGPERRFFTESYQRSGRYMDMIQSALKEAGLPQDLAWLPLIESGFKVRALSRARALGLWQFIPSTGYKFGLKRDTWIDERMDPEKSTAAAIAYLKELHQIFGDWTTVLAGYNCGEGTVLRKIRNQKINYLDNFWDLYQQLPSETARYVPRFLATLHILRDPAKYGFELNGTDSPASYETVTIEKPIQLKKVAKKLGIEFKELTAINSELRHHVTPPTQYTMRLPAGKRNLFLAHINEIPKWSPPRSAYVYHRVKKGETLSLIATRYRTSVIKIVRANNIRKKHFIRVGQKLKIPLRGASNAGRTYAAAGKLLPGGKYEIKKGDSLWLIARKFNTNTKKLQSLNNLSTTRLNVGQVLKIK